VIAVSGVAKLAENFPCLVVIGHFFTSEFIAIF
jgi:hypothetical protein